MSSSPGTPAPCKMDEFPEKTPNFEIRGGDIKPVWNFSWNFGNFGEGGHPLDILGFFFRQNIDFNLSISIGNDNFSSLTSGPDDMG